MSPPRKSNIDDVPAASDELLAVLAPIIMSSIGETSNPSSALAMVIVAVARRLSIANSYTFVVNVGDEGLRVERLIAMLQHLTDDQTHAEAVFAAALASAVTMLSANQEPSHTTPSPPRNRQRRSASPDPHPPSNSNSPADMVAKLLADALARLPSHHASVGTDRDPSVVATNTSLGTICPLLPRKVLAFLDSLPAPYRWAREPVDTADRLRALLTDMAVIETVPEEQLFVRGPPFTGVELSLWREGSRQARLEFAAARRSQDPDALLLLLAARAECADPSRLAAHAAGQLALPEEPLWPRRQAQGGGKRGGGGGGGGGSTKGGNPSKN